jgi:hypothetical protein
MRTPIRDGGRRRSGRCDARLRTLPVFDAWTRRLSQHKARRPLPRTALTAVSRRDSVDGANDTPSRSALDRTQASNINTSSSIGSIMHTHKTSSFHQVHASGDIRPRINNTYLVHQSSHMRFKDKIYFWIKLRRRKQLGQSCCSSTASIYVEAINQSSTYMNIT